MREFPPARSTYPLPPKTGGPPRCSRPMSVISIRASTPLYRECDGKSGLNAASLDWMPKPAAPALFDQGLAGGGFVRIHHVVHKTRNVFMSASTIIVDPLEPSELIALATLMSQWKTVGPYLCLLEQISRNVSRSWPPESLPYRTRVRVSFSAGFEAVFDHRGS